MNYTGKHMFGYNVLFKKVIKKIRKITTEHGDKKAKLMHRYNILYKEKKMGQNTLHISSHLSNI